MKWLFAIPLDNLRIPISEIHYQRTSLEFDKGTIDGDCNLNETNSQESCYDFDLSVRPSFHVYPHRTVRSLNFTYFLIQCLFCYEIACCGGISRDSKMEYA